MQLAFLSRAPIRFAPSPCAHHGISSPLQKTSLPGRTLRMTQTIKRPSPAIPQSKEAKKPKAAPKLIVEGDTIESTPFQKALLAAFLGTAAAVAAKIIAQTESPEQALMNVGALALSYFFTDFAVGVYHHAVDNYGSAETPIFGFQIAAFQGHHSFPWTITARGVANNLYRLTYLTLPQLMFLLAQPVPTPVMSLYGSFLCFIVLSQETHRQAHMTRAAPWVRFLQDTGLILSQKAHARHHLAPPKGAFEGNYCILTGFWNDILDRSKFFRLHEALIFRATGTEPIAWSLDSKLRAESLKLLPDWLR